ncbi:hypothetical protein [Halalkalicoccus ordinarius]|uniref:hypothetical protein n=1 Tax=Halalkalicoccus ordinarius TaxID=3116651 RepID=UPI00300F3760
MQTHTKEAGATIGAFVALTSVIHGGIWFTVFGTPDFTVLGFPFHYFWLVAGGPAAMFVLYAVYYRYITTAIIDEKERLRADVSETSTEPSDIDG